MVQEKGAVQSQTTNLNLTSKNRLPNLKSRIWGPVLYTYDYFSKGKVSQIEFTFEICSEAPGYNNNWPSNITLEINHNPVVTFLTKGDYGGRKGSCNPDWWSDSNSQFGEFKRFTITDQGSFPDGEKVSEETIESPKMKEGYHFSFILKVDYAAG